MSGGGIYLVRDSGELVEMLEESYESEDLLQTLLEQHPRVLGGTHLDTSEKKKWLLIKREAPLPGEEEGPDRWSVDHLFLDQQAVPTIVEVKRSTDTRIRREVVGQMLDYAANGVVYWPVERLRSFFQASCEAEGKDPDATLEGFLGAAVEPEEFWQNVKTNLQAGRVRLVFVADQIPPELRRIIEFLNRQTDPAEVIGIEIQQYVGTGVKTLVPTVIGLTAESERKKAAGDTRRWDHPTFFDELAKVASASELDLAHRLLEFGEQVTGRDVDFGTGSARGSFTARLVIPEHRFSVFSVYTTAQFSLNFGWGVRRHRAQELGEKFRNLTRGRLGLDFSRRTWTSGWPMTQLSYLDGGRLDDLKQLVIEFIADARKLAAGSPID
jgi:hypothetical protein